jgi:hypothetical protein
MVVVAVGEPSTPVTCCAVAGAAASKAVRIKLKINGAIARFFIVFLFVCDRLIATATV